MHGGGTSVGGGWWHIMGGVDFGPHLVDDWQGISGGGIYEGGGVNQRSRCSRNHWSSSSGLFQRQRSVSIFIGDFITHGLNGP